MPLNQVRRRPKADENPAPIPVNTRVVNDLILESLKRLSQELQPRSPCELLCVIDHFSWKPRNNI